MPNVNLCRIEPTEIFAGDKIPHRGHDIRGINSKPDANVVKIYHEMTDDFGNVIRDARTFDLKDNQASECLSGVRNAPAYLSKNFNDVMQHIASLKAENAEMKRVM